MRPLLPVLLIVLALTGAGMAQAETVRIATYDTELSRRGPGLLLADILKREEQVMAVAGVIAEVAPDIILLSGFDHDTEGHALAAFADLLEAQGLGYAHRFAARPNAGVPSGHDLDGNGKLGEARDSQGYGRFTGDGGMAVLSSFPIGEVRDFSGLLWAELPGALLPSRNGQPFPSAAAQKAQRLSSVAHWEVPVTVGGTVLRLLAFNPTTPVFDGPEDQNGRRNHDEIMFWRLLLDGALPFAPPPRPVIVLGNANLDPVDGDGRHEAIHALLGDPRLQDPAPKSPGGKAAATPGHQGDPALDTVDWNDPRPGNMRVDYLLPDAALGVTDAGVFWPEPETPLAETAAAASRHRLVWVDIALP